MQKNRFLIVATGILYAVLLFSSNNISACSTFKLQKGNELIYGHNLNEADMDVPGMVFINKRGIFKTGCTFSEMLVKDQPVKSNFSWISRYGSVTFNAFGRDLPDGGMNEAGLYIWEMNERADLPKNDKLPVLMHMNWIQYMLDNLSTLDEAIQSASWFQLEDGGMTWHYFISDATGNCASLAFIDGKVKVNRGENMPVTALFNTPYDREMELLKYYKGYGGLYDIDLKNPRVPRFAKTAVMLKSYDPSQDAVGYGFEILKAITVDNIPEWSIIFDANRKNVYFKTRINPEIKSFAIESFDFSNKTPVQILDIDTKEGGDVFNRFQPYSSDALQNYYKTKMLKVVPEKFFTHGGLTVNESIDRFINYDNRAELPESQHFAGTWKNKPASSDEDTFQLKIWTIKNAVFGEITTSVSTYPLDHLRMSGNKFACTYRTKKGTFVELKGNLNNNQMPLQIAAEENDPFEVVFFKQ